MVRISGLFHLLINGVYWGYNPFTSFLGHPSVSDGCLVGKAWGGNYIEIKI